MGLLEERPTGGTVVVEQQGAPNANDSEQLRKSEDLAAVLQESLKENFAFKTLSDLTSVSRITSDRSDLSTSSGSPNNTTTDEDISDLGSNSSVDGRLPEGSVSPVNVGADSPDSGIETGSSDHGTPKAPTPNAVLGVSGRPIHEKKHICDICGKAFPYMSILESHKRCHTGEKPFSCHFCDKKFAQKATLQVHERTHTGERPYKCRYCVKTFAQYGTKTVHEKSAHLGIRNYKCPLCDKCLSSPSALYTHKKTHGEKVFKCEFCTKTFTLKNYLKLHVKQVHEQTERKHICNFCSKSFAYAGSLQVHIRTHTGERPYVCKYCPKAFASQGNLQSHERTHTGERPYSCTTCGRSFIQKSQLTAHEATHSNSSSSSVINGESSPEGIHRPVPKVPVGHKTHGAFDYPCTMCGRRYAVASGLCKLCETTFVTQGQIPTSAGEKPYKCPGCAKSFVQKIALSIHLEQCQAQLAGRVRTTESESPINVETDSDCGSDSGSATQKALDMFLPNIYSNPYEQQPCEEPQRLSSSLPFRLSQEEQTSLESLGIKLPMMTSSGIGASFSLQHNNVPQQTPMRAPEAPPADFGPLAGSKPPFQPDVVMPESLSAFHAPQMTSAAATQPMDTSHPPTSIPPSPTVEPGLLASLMGSTSLATLSNLTSLASQLPINPTQLLNTQQLLMQLQQFQQNQTDQLMSQLLAAGSQSLLSVPNLFPLQLQNQNSAVPQTSLNGLQTPQLACPQPIKPIPIEAKNGHMLA